MNIFIRFVLRGLAIFSSVILVATHTYGQGIFDAVNPMKVVNPIRDANINKYYSKIRGEEFGNSLCKPFPSETFLSYTGVGWELASQRFTIFVAPIGDKLIEMTANKKGKLSFPYRAFINLKSLSTWVICPTEYTLSLSESQFRIESIENEKKIIEEQLARKAEYHKRNEERFKKCPFCRFSQTYEMETEYDSENKYGGEYLDAIYRGDNASKNFISWQFLAEFQDDRKSNSALNTILTEFSGGNLTWLNRYDHPS